MLDSIKTVTAGGVGWSITWMDSLPIIIRALVGVATFIYICVKIYKEIRD